MNALHHPFEWLKEAAREHWLAVLLLIPPVIWVVYQSDASNVFPMLPLPIVALAIGFALRPRHVWILWLAAVVFEWITVIAWGKYNEPGSGETLTSTMLEAFAWMAMGVLLPAWLGRLLRAASHESPPTQAPPA